MTPPRSLPVSAITVTYFHHFYCNRESQYADILPTILIVALHGSPLTYSYPTELCWHSSRSSQ
ncbi:hypothetical protein L210DRAFT_2347737 [Boletus edulis BED1]|uniref:Uncharacterized protein n=1 Tax=Boletus edulis BED1 TaxID=1328754 RepID=A0AAD4G645_BOLED|nr:hypothetical protein L210DRAFT_2347737 [Boletus edulis BED1]